MSGSQVYVPDTHKGVTHMNLAKPLAAIAFAAVLMPQSHPAHAGVTNQLRNLRAPLSTPGPGVGIVVYLQPWSPLTPDVDAPRTALNEPAGISAPMNAAWDAVRRYLSDPKNPNSVPALLSKGGLIAKGINLYDVTLTTNPLSTITLQHGGGPGGPMADAFTVHWIIAGTRLDFRSTTPDAVRGVGLSRELDPKLSVQLDLDITLGLAVSDRAGQPALQVTETVVHIANPRVDSGNFSGDVIKAITNFCSEVVYGRNLDTLLAYAFGDKNLAADPRHGGLDLAGVQSLDVKQMANDRLQALNAQIASSGAADYLRVGLWTKNGAGAPHLVLLFAPKTVPLPPQTASLSGNVLFDKSAAAAQPPADCHTVIGNGGVVVDVQTGPRKILDVEPFVYGVAPTLRLQNIRFSGGPLANGTCAFTLSGLVDSWPNNISFPAPAISGRGSLGNIGHYLQLRPDGWTSPVTMAAAVSNHNLRAGGSMVYNAGVGAQRKPGAAVGFVNPANTGDPGYNPAAAATAPAAPGAWSAKQAPATYIAPAATTVWGAPAAPAAINGMAHPELPANGRLQQSAPMGAQQVTSAPQ